MFNQKLLLIVIKNSYVELNVLLISTRRIFKNSSVLRKEKKIREGVAFHELALAIHLFMFNPPTTTLAIYEIIFCVFVFALMCFVLI